MQTVQRKNPGLGDTVVPVIITVYADRSFTFVTKSAPASVLLKKAANIKSGSKTPQSNVVGKVTMAQVEEIAKAKLEDLNGVSLESAISQVQGTAKSMGLEVVN